MVSKERGTQIIEHFCLNTEIDQVVNKINLYFNKSQTLLDPETEYHVDLLCDEISDFSFYFENYKVYVLKFIKKCLKIDKSTA